MNLTDYIKGRRHGREAHRIERETMRDPLLQDAIDGFDAVPGDHEEVLRRLRKRLEAKVQPRKRQSSRNFYRIAVAAAFVGVLFMGYRMIWRHDDEPPTLLAYETEVAPDTAVAPITVPVPPVEEEVAPEVAAPVLRDEIQIVDDNTAIETEQVFADFDTAFIEGPDTDEMSEEATAKEITADELRRQGTGSVVAGIKNLDPTFYVVEENNIMGSDANTLPMIAKRGGKPRPLDSLSAVKAFYDYIALYPHEGRIVLEFTANGNGRPAKIRVVESSATDNGAGRRAIRLLRGSDIAWPVDKTMRVVKL